MKGSRGKVLRVKLGYNPNSSSLGTGIQVLLFGSAALSFVVVVLSTVIRLRRKAKVSDDGNARDNHLSV